MTREQLKKIISDWLSNNRDGSYIGSDDIMADDLSSLLLDGCFDFEELMDRLMGTNLREK